MDYSIGTSVLENWRIVRFLGEGANGKVFEIHKTDHGVTTKSALKVMRVPRSESDIRAALSEGMDQRSVTTYFQGVVDEIVKEIALMAELKSHPAIVSCEDYQVIDHPGEIGWDILIRMELLTALPDYQMNSPLGEADVLRMGRELCGALVLCQKKGMIHRDVKPENIFVSEFGQFKLGDFGVARTVEKTTGGLSKKGTESYMAPEVYLGRPYGGSVDIYSLGLVLYKFLNRGRLPFFPAWPSPITFADRENALSARMQGKAFPYPCDACDSFARVILKACTYDPKERYRTAAEFLEALNQVELPQNAGKVDASGSFAGTSEIYTDEKTMGMYGGSDTEEKTVGMYGGSDAEEKTVGMYGGSDVEGKTVGTYSDSVAEEKTVGMYGSQDAEGKVEPKESVRQPSQPPEQEKTIKKTRKTAPWIVAAAAAIGIIAIAVFMQSNKKYQVTVSNGSGAGAYKAGEEVALIAEDRSAEDLEFSGWEVIEGEITLGDAAEECDFSMPKSDVEVAAQYTPKKHHVKVTDGEGEGEYIAGDEVTLHAVNDSKDQQVFSGWEVTKGEVTLSDAFAETCSFIMPQSNVEIKCNFENIYQVTVNDGNGSGTYKAGDEVTLTAEDRSAENLVFTGWEVTEGEIMLGDASAETCSFIMPQSDVKIKGTFEKIYQVTVSGGSGSGTYREGDKVTLTAKDRSAEDLEFTRWEVTEGEITLGDAAEECGFLMPKSDVEVAAQYAPKKYYVKVIDGEGEGEYIAGEEVTLTAADRSAEDLKFTGWEVTEGEITLGDAAEKCGFLMPKSDVEVAAQYTPKKHYVKVKNGEGEGEYIAGEEVTLTAADRSAEDLEFIGWKVTKGEITLGDVSAETCSFLMPRSDVEISAMYKKKLQLEWENVIDRLMEPETWMSNDGKINYAEFSEEDWDTYQANYNLAVWDYTYSGWIMPVLPIKEYAERDEDGYTRLRLYDMLDNEDYYSEIFVHGMGTNLSITFEQIYYPDAKAKAGQSDHSHWRKGLYPKCGGIYLDERYDAVLEQLGITEKMLDWLLCDDRDFTHGYGVSFREDQESYIYIGLHKELKRISMAFDYNEGNSHYYLHKLEIEPE